MALRDVNASTPPALHVQSRRLNLDEDLGQEWVNDLMLLAGQAKDWAWSWGIGVLCGGLVLGTCTGCVMWLWCFRKTERPGGTRQTMLEAFRRFRFCSEYPRTTTFFVAVMLLSATALAAWSVYSRASKAATSIDPGLAGQSASEFGLALLQKLGELTDAISQTVQWELRMTNPTHAHLIVTDFKAVVRVGELRTSPEVATMKSSKDLELEPLTTKDLVLQARVSRITALVGAGTTLIKSLFSNLLFLRAEIDMEGRWDSSSFSIHIASEVPFDKNELPPLLDWPGGALLADDGAKAKKSLAAGMKQYHQEGGACIKFEDLKVRSPTVTWVVVVLVCIVAHVALAQSCLVCLCCSLCKRNQREIGTSGAALTGLDPSQVELRATLSLPPSPLFMESRSSHTRASRQSTSLRHSTGHASSQSTSLRYSSGQPFPHHSVQPSYFTGDSGRPLA